MDAWFASTFLAVVNYTAVNMGVQMSIFRPRFQFFWVCNLEVEILDYIVQTYLALLYFTDTAFCFFYKLKVCNDPSAGEPASTIFPSFAHFVSYFGNFPNISNFFIIMLQWSLKLLLQLGKGSDETWHVLAASDVLIKIYTWFFRPNAVAHLIDYLLLLLF